jgi:hypothetical protein
MRTGSLFLSLPDKNQQEALCATWCWAHLLYGSHFTLQLPQGDDLPWWQSELKGQTGSSPHGLGGELYTLLCREMSLHIF